MGALLHPTDIEPSYTFAPKDNITAKDIAEALQLMGLSFQPWAFKNLSPSAQKHFKLSYPVLPSRHEKL